MMIIIYRGRSHENIMQPDADIVIRFRGQLHEFVNEKIPDIW